MGLFEKIADLLVPYIPAEKLPTSAKTLVKTLQGDKSPITSQNFSNEELEIISDLVANSKGRGHITYADYIDVGRNMKKAGKMPFSVTPGLFSMGDALGNVQTTLGRFSYSKDDSGTRITDTYDFNPVSAGLAAGLAGPYGLIRNYAGNKIPPGSGRVVDFVIPNAPNEMDLTIEAIKNRSNSKM